MTKLFVVQPLHTGPGTRSVNENISMVFGSFTVNKNQAFNNEDSLVSIYISCAFLTFWQSLDRKFVIAKLSITFLTSGSVVTFVPDSFGCSPLTVLFTSLQIHLSVCLLPLICNEAPQTDRWSKGGWRKSKMYRLFSKILIKRVKLVNLSLY